MNGPYSVILKLISIILLLSACVDKPENSSKEAHQYPFNDNQLKSSEQLSDSLLWVNQLILAPNNHRLLLEPAIKELVPYSFSSSDTYEVGHLDSYENSEILRYQIVIQVNSAMKIYLEVHINKVAPTSWEFLRVTSYLNGYRYLKKYPHPDKITRAEKGLSF